MLNTQPVHKHLHVDHQHGSIVMMVVIMLPLLLATIGLALDVSRLFVVKSELQNAADACALAAARELDGAVNQFTRAENAGMALAAANKTLFQNENVSATANSSVQFSTAVNGSYNTKGGAAANANYARCVLQRANVQNFVIHLAGIGNQSVSASAVAANRPGQNTCAIPISVCQSALVGKSKGAWLQGILTPSSKTEDLTGGQFNWSDLNVGGGAKTLAELLTGDNTCFADPPIGTPIGVSGYKASARDEYNSRFGIYANSVKGSPAPDVTGKGYYSTNWTVNTDAYNDYLANKYVPYTAVSGIQFAGNPTIYNSSQLQANGRNRRLAVAPIVNCSAGHTLTGYACVFLLHPVRTQGASNATMYLEYLGDATNSITPCNQSGLAGSSAGTGPRVTTLVQ